MEVNIVKNFAFNVRYERSILAVREHVSGASYRFNGGQFNEALIFAFQYSFRKKSE